MKERWKEEFNEGKTTFGFGQKMTLEKLYDNLQYSNRNYQHIPLLVSTPHSHPKKFK